MSEFAPLVCIYATEEPGVPSTLVQCARCGAELWRSNGSFSAIDVEPWCYRCVALKTRAGGMHAVMRPEERFAAVERFMADDGLTRERAEALVDELLAKLNRGVDE